MRLRKGGGRLGRKDWKWKGKKEKEVKKFKQIRDVEEWESEDIGKG